MMNSFSQPKKSLNLSSSLRKKTQPKLTNFFSKGKTVSSQDTDLIVVEENEEGADNIIFEKKINPPVSLDSTPEDIEERFSDDDFDLNTSLRKERCSSSVISIPDDSDDDDDITRGRHKVSKAGKRNIKGYLKEDVVRDIRSDIEDNEYNGTTENANGPCRSVSSDAEDIFADIDADQRVDVDEDNDRSPSPVLSSPLWLTKKSPVEPKTLEIKEKSINDNDKLEKADVCKDADVQETSKESHCSHTFVGFDMTLQNVPLKPLGITDELKPWINDMKIILVLEEFQKRYQQ